jgi:hypothetical protein
MQLVRDIIPNDVNNNTTILCDHVCEMVNRPSTTTERIIYILNNLREYYNPDHNSGIREPNIFDDGVVTFY